MQEELDQLEASNHKLNAKARSMALNQPEDSMQAKAARYKKQRNESIFGDEDCVKTAPIRKAAP